MLRFINNLRGSLASDISATSNPIELDSDTASRLSAMFPSYSYDILALTLFSATQLEVVYVMDRDAQSNYFYLQRGREGTTAAAWPAGSAFEARLTAAVVDALPRQALAMMLTNGQDVLVGWDGDVLWATDVPHDAYFY